MRNVFLMALLFLALSMLCFEESSAVLLCDIPDACGISQTSQVQTSPSRTLAEQYLYTLRGTLTGFLLETDSHSVSAACNRKPFNISARMRGAEWPLYAITMAGQFRMNLLHEVLTKVYLERKLTGDFLEAGVWRGGSSVYARAFAEAYGLNYTVYLADSFQGLPPSTHMLDAPDQWSVHDYLRVSQEQVADNMIRFLPWLRRDDARDDHDKIDGVKFVKGFFADSLPRLVGSPVSAESAAADENRSRKDFRELAVLRVDGDMYSSTLQVLCYLYDYLAVGGICILDDFNIEESRRAVMDFFRGMNITKESIGGGIQMAKDGIAAWFQKTEPVRKNWHRNPSTSGPSTRARSVSQATEWCILQLGLAQVDGAWNTFPRRYRHKLEAYAQINN